MSAQIASMARRSALMTAAVAAVMLAISALVGGGKGAIGGAIAVAVVGGFFALTWLAFVLGAKVSPQAMAGAGMAMYFVKILVLLILVGAFRDSTVFNGVLFAVTVIVLVLAYQVALVVTWNRTKMLYVEPDGER